MQDIFKSISREQLLDNLYIHTSKKFPHKPSQSSTVPYIVDFFDYSGMLYYFKDGIRADLTGDVPAHFDITVDDVIEAVNRNTSDDLLVFPTVRMSVYKLFDKNGDSVERILLNRDKLVTYLRTMDDGFGLLIYPAKPNLWFIVVDTIEEDNELRRKDLAFIQQSSSCDISFFYKLDSFGSIEKLTLS